MATSAPEHAVSMVIHTPSEPKLYAIRPWLGRAHDAQKHALGETLCYGGFIAGLELFDNNLFRISRHEASYLDPNQRLVLEQVGSVVARTSRGPGSSIIDADRVGVFLGIESSDWTRLQDAQLPSNRRRSFESTSHALSIASGRIAFVFNFGGPAVSVDTACSASLVALSLGAWACTNDESGADADEVAVGAVKTMLHPHQTIVYARAGMLAPDGRCKTSDARADGYVRAEGVLATWAMCEGVADVSNFGLCIQGSATAQDGRSASLTAPSGAAQRRLLSATRIKASILSIDQHTTAHEQIEMHGTGTSLGDPIEVAAAVAVHGAAELSGGKANVGHTECSAGLVGLGRVEALMRSNAMEANAHLRTLNPTIIVCA